MFVEDQNAFRVNGKSATLAGKPDLVALGDLDVTIIEVKTGREQAWHRVQVMIYQYGLPLAVSEYRDVRVGGEAVYSDRMVKIPPGAVSCQFVEDLVALIRRLATDPPRGRVPSAAECRFCDIGRLGWPGTHGRRRAGARGFYQRFQTRDISESTMHFKRRHYSPAAHIDEADALPEPGRWWVPR